MSHTHDDEFDALRPLIDGVHAKEIDQPRIAAAVREILEAIGEDPDRDGLQSTPSRVARMYAEVCSGLHQDPAEHLKTTFEAGHDEMVMVRDIPLYSLCEHHLIPFLGKAHVAYIPNENGRVTGLSKLARLVDGYAKRPQVQERLTRQVADAIEVLDASPYPEDGLVPLEVPTGTLVVLNGALPHRSGPNRSDRSRHAYTLHVIERAADYPADNRLQRPDLPLRPVG